MNIGFVKYTLFMPAFLAAVTSLGGEVKAPDNDLEAKVKALEQRVKELESIIERMREPQRDPRADRFNNRHMDELFERMRRQMEQFGPGPGRIDPFEDMPAAPRAAHRPRLGVDLAPVSDDLIERFNNKADSGAFVMSIVPNSPAEKSGMLTGDCIIQFGDKKIASPQELREAIIAAPKGRNEAVVLRKGESMKLTIMLGETYELSEVDLDDKLDINDGWLRKKDFDRASGGNSAARTQVDVKASALQLSDDLAQRLKLTDDQRKKMNEVLADKQLKLNQDVSQKAGKRSGNTFNFTLGNDLHRLVDKYAGEAEKELAATLSADQIKQWADYRKEHNSVSMSHSYSFQSGGESNTNRPAGATGF